MAYRESVNPEVISQQISENGSLVGNNSSIALDPDSTEQYSPVVASGNGQNDLVVWVDKRRGWDIEMFDIYGQLYNKSHEKVGGNFIIYSGVNLAIFKDIAIAPDNGGGFVVVCKVRNDSYDSILLATLVSEDGQVITDAVPIIPESESFDCKGQDVAVNDYGEIIISYVEVDSDQVIFQICSGNLESIGDPITAYDGNGNPTYSSKLAVADNGDFCVLINEQNGIFIQYFNEDGVSAGPLIEVDDENCSHGICDIATSPSIAISPDGERVVVAWTSEKYKYGFPKVLARVFKNKEPVGDIEIIEEQGHKPNAHAYIWKNGLACNNDQIVFVWSENRTNRNLDIYCKTTDWNLTTIEEVILNRQALKVWPVPAEERVYFSEGGRTFEIWDLQGRLINKTDKPMWNLSDSHGRKVPSGIYFVENENNERGKIVVQ